jgi:hypothetical protein
MWTSSDRKEISLYDLTNKMENFAFDSNCKSITGDIFRAALEVMSNFDIMCPVILSSFINCAKWK